MRKAVWMILGAGAVVVAAVGAAGCREDDCTFTATCPQATSVGGADGGSDAGYPEVPPPANCVPDNDPKDQPACVDDAYALFVDLSNGNDADDGSHGRPLHTLGEATKIDRLRGRPRIYVCSGTYEEQITLPPGVSLIGGFACRSWSYDASNVARIAPTKPGLAVRISPSDKPVTLSDLQIDPPDGVDGEESSIGVFVALTPSAFRRVAITSGRGAASGAWSTPPLSNHLDGPDLNGNKAPGAARTCKCPLSGESTGGAAGEAPEQNGHSGAQGTDDTFANFGSGGSSCTPGGKGKTGSFGGGGGLVATFGRLDLDRGWVGAPAPDGTAGGVGGGGGGGGADVSHNGGGGGCGGCGGAPGRGGKAGGASIALAALDAKISLYACTLVAKDGGSGATGENGATGDTGGVGGNAAEPSPCGGGEGGPGGNGGAGTGGTGGLSAAFVLSGGSYFPDGASTLKNGFNGLSGAKGHGVASAFNSAPGGDGSDGYTVPKTDPIYEIPR